jgi:hypothetical protein
MAAESEVREQRESEERRGEDRLDSAWRPTEASGMS